MSNTVSNMTKYQYFIFMNSSVRGPHLPIYWPVSFSVLGTSDYNVLTTFFFLTPELGNRIWCIGAQS